MLNRQYPGYLAVADTCNTDLQCFIESIRLVAETSEW
jgi:hypothetical protein